MTKQSNQQGQHSDQNNQSPLDKNKTLHDAGASVPDYGHSEQEAVEENKRNFEQKNSTMPLDNDETIGNP